MGLESSKCDDTITERIMEAKLSALYEWPVKQQLHARGLGWKLLSSLILLTGFIFS